MSTPLTQRSWNVAWAATWVAKADMPVSRRVFFITEVVWRLPKQEDIGDDEQ